MEDKDFKSAVEVDVAAKPKEFKKEAEAEAKKEEKAEVKKESEKLVKKEVKKEAKKEEKRSKLRHLKHLLQKESLNLESVCTLENNNSTIKLGKYA